MTQRIALQPRLFSAAQHCSAQWGIIAPPHDSGIYLYVEKNNVKRITGLGLERASYQGHKTGGVWGYALTGGIMKAKIKAVIPGPRASIRTGEQRPTFYFYFEEKSAGLGKSGFGGPTVSNPNQFSLLKLEVKKDNRETITGKVGMASASSGTDEEAMVAFRSERLRPGVYRVIPTANLESGEYCFLASGAGAASAGAAAAVDIFDFGVTPNDWVLTLIPARAVWTTAGWWREPPTLILRYCQEDN